jgi:hypothetical protein
MHYLLIGLYLWLTVGVLFGSFCAASVDEKSGLAFHKRAAFYLLACALFAVIGVPVLIFMGVSKVCYAS